MTVEQLIKIPQYTIDKYYKDTLLLSILKKSILMHKTASSAYSNILDSLKYSENEIINLGSIPFLPVRLFKELELRSIAKNEIFKILTSSGTTSENVSKIYLDKESALLQTKALSSIITSFIGPTRLPMVIVDSKSVLKNRAEFSARGAGILGLSNFGRDHFYLLNEKMELDLNGFERFLEVNINKNILFFGFTFMVWKYFIEQLMSKHIHYNLNNAILIHSGGWKKLTELNISNKKFKEEINTFIGINRVYNFYGMVEQIGGVYMECEEGFFHASNFTEIIIRSNENFEVVENGYEGLLQTISLLPSSYPGNSILTEDIGIIQGVDDCRCSRKGTYFNIIGRIPKSELRGCSDTHAFQTVGNND